MNILLVYPRYPDTFWSFKHALRYVSRKAAFPPLGLLTVAAMLPEGWNKKLVDVNVSDLTDADIEWADMVFISAMIVQKQNAQEIIHRCNARGKTVVAGGPVFSSQPEYFTGVDHYVLNEAEVTLPLFLADLRAGRPQPRYASAEKPDITHTPAPLWSLIRLKDYATIPVQYSRGCPFDCEFCDIIVMLGRKPRTKTPEQMIHEFQTLYDAGWRGGVFIVDDNFIGNKVRVKQLLPRLIEWQKAHNYPFNLLTEASVNLADDQELMRLMSDANFQKIFLGIETPDLDSLKECGKTQNTTRSLADAVHDIHQHGMQVMGGFIVGFDSDTESIFQRQINFIQKTGIVQAMVGLLNAVPQTRLWHRLKAEGRLVSDSSGENTDGSTNFIPRMGEKKLVEGYKKILASIYSPREYYTRIHTFTKTYKPQPKGRPPVREIIAFLRSLWDIGVVSSSRLLYWKLLAKTLVTRRQTLPVAVELAIFGQHFEKVMKKIVEV